MQPERNEAYECYCLKCHAAADEAAEACVQCATPFVGSGVFDKVRGPRPSALFEALFHPCRIARAA